jgi:hypothetical protein
MVNAMDVVLVAVPETPLIVTVYLPGTAELLMVKVREVVLPLTTASEPVTPAGTPVAVILTLLFTRLIGLVTTILTGLL